ILACSHGETLYQKNPDIFQAVIKNIESKEEKLLEMLRSRRSVRIEDLTLKGLIYPLKSMEKFKKVIPDFEKIGQFWEYYFMKNLLEDLEAKGRVSRLNENKWRVNS
ncbi:MAG: hypothetical protein ACXQS8_04350, partial [Candidatus Helarchaeales archaeon]